jgi:uncharacterized protein YdhG (YjbR/CyaY superfamily)
MNTPGPPTTVDAYLATLPEPARAVLEAVMATVREAAPQAQERISYRMPAFFMGGVVVYVAAFKHHIGLYPPVRDAALAARLQRYAGPKGNLRFPLDEPMPHELIAQVVKARLREVQASTAAKAPRRRAGVKPQGGNPA